jgi:hypothetical protein
MESTHDHPLAARIAFWAALLTAITFIVFTVCFIVVYTQGTPAAWTGIEYGVSLISPHGSWGALGYSQVSFPPAIQIASLFGLYAITFTLCLFANALALIARGNWKAALPGLAASETIRSRPHAALLPAQLSRAPAPADGWDLASSSSNSPGGSPPIPTTPTTPGASCTTKPTGSRFSAPSTPTRSARATRSSRSAASTTRCPTSIRSPATCTSTRARG